MKSGFVKQAWPKKPSVHVYPQGTPLTAPRLCLACKESHPVGTTCAGGWAPWDGHTSGPLGYKPIIEEQVVVPVVPVVPRKTRV